MLLGSNTHNHHNQIDCCLLPPAEDGDYNAWTWSQSDHFESIQALHDHGTESIYAASSPPQLTEYTPTILIEQSARPGAVVLGHSPEQPRVYVKAELPSNVSQSQPASEPSTAASNSPSAGQSSAHLEPFFEPYNYDAYDAFSPPAYQTGASDPPSVPGSDGQFVTESSGHGEFADWRGNPSETPSTDVTTPGGGELTSDLFLPLSPFGGSGVMEDYNSPWRGEAEMTGSEKRRSLNQSRRYKEDPRDLGGGFGSPKESKRRLGQSTKIMPNGTCGSSGSDAGVGKNGPGGVACCRGVYFDQIRHLWRANWPEESVIIDRATQRMVDIRRCTRTKGFSAKKYGYQEAQRLAIEHREKMTGPGMVRHFVYQDETNPIAQIPGSRSARKRQQQAQASIPPPPLENSAAPEWPVHIPLHPPPQAEYYASGNEETTDWGTPWQTDDYPAGASAVQTPPSSQPEDSLLHLPNGVGSDLASPTSADTLFAHMPPLHMHHLVDVGVLTPL